MSNLAGRRVAVLLTDGFEQVEMTEPRKALEGAGAQVDLVAPESGQVQGWNHTDPADAFPVDRTLAEVSADDYQAVLLPGGVVNADTIRVDDKAQALVKDFEAQGKPIFVICHGAWLLASAGLVKGRRITSWPSLQDDLRNAGADWVDEQVVVDGSLISSRKPDDLPAFNQAIVDALAG